jgi:hypothetical protein
MSSRLPIEFDLVQPAGASDAFFTSAASCGLTQTGRDVRASPRGHCRAIRFWHRDHVPECSAGNEVACPSDP